MAQIMDEAIYQTEHAHIMHTGGPIDGMSGHLGYPESTDLNSRPRMEPQAEIRTDSTSFPQGKLNRKRSDGRRHSAVYASLERR